MHWFIYVYTQQTVRHLGGLYHSNTAPREGDDGTGVISHKSPLMSFDILNGVTRSFWRNYSTPTTATLHHTKVVSEKV